LAGIAKPVHPPFATRLTRTAMETAPSARACQRRAVVPLRQNGPALISRPGPEFALNAEQFIPLGHALAAGERTYL
jgi:hypothetical protein